MADKTTAITFRMDPDLKAEADALFAELGLDLITALNIFVRQAVRDRGIPFLITLDPTLNREAMAMILEKRGIGLTGEGYMNLNELSTELKA